MITQSYGVYISLKIIYLKTRLCYLRGSWKYYRLRLKHKRVKRGRSLRSLKPISCHFVSSRAFILYSFVSFSIVPLLFFSRLCLRFLSSLHSFHFSHRPHFRPHKLRASCFLFCRRILPMRRRQLSLNVRHFVLHFFLGLSCCSSSLLLSVSAILVPLPLRAFGPRPFGFPARACAYASLRLVAFFFLNKVPFMGGVKDFFLYLLRLCRGDTLKR